MALSPGVVPSYRIAIPHYWEGLVNEDVKGAATLTDFRHHLRNPNLRIVGEAGAEHDNRRRELRAKYPDFSEYMISILMYQDEQKERQEAEQERFRLAEILEARSRRHVQGVLQRAEPPVAIGVDGRPRTMSRDTRQWLSEHDPRELQQWELVLAAAKQREREEKMARVPDIWAQRHAKLEKKLAVEEANLAASKVQAEEQRAAAAKHFKDFGSEPQMKNKLALDKLEEEKRQKLLEKLRAKTERAAQAKAAHDQAVAEKFHARETAMAEHAASARAQIEASPPTKRASIAHQPRAPDHPKPKDQRSSSTRSDPLASSGKAVRFTVGGSTASGLLASSQSEMALEAILANADSDAQHGAADDTTPTQSEPSSPAGFGLSKDAARKAGKLAPPRQTAVVVSASLTQSKAEHIRVRDEKAQARRARQEAASAEFAREQQTKQRAAAKALQLKADQARARVEAALTQQANDRHAEFEKAKAHEDHVLAEHEQRLAAVVDDTRRRLEVEAGIQRINYAAREAERLAKLREIELKQFEPTPQGGRGRLDPKPLTLAQQSDEADHLSLTNTSWSHLPTNHGSAQELLHSATAAGLSQSSPSASSPRPAGAATTATMPFSGGASPPRMDEATRAQLVKEQQAEQAKTNKARIDSHNERVANALKRATEMAVANDPGKIEAARREKERKAEEAKTHTAQRHELELLESQKRWQLYDAENKDRRALHVLQRDDAIARRQAALGVASEAMHRFYGLPSLPVPQPPQTARSHVVRANAPSTAPHSARRANEAKERHERHLEDAAKERRSQAEAHAAHIEAVEAARRDALRSRSKEVAQFRKAQPPSPPRQEWFHHIAEASKAAKGKVEVAEHRRNELIEERRAGTAAMLQRKAEITESASRQRARWTELGDAKASARRVRHATRFVLVHPRASSPPEGSDAEHADDWSL